MVRKKANIISTLGFRTDCEDLFRSQIASRKHLKHTTPFIFYLNGIAEAIYYTNELLKKTRDDDVVLKAWAGQWKTDVFAFKIKDLREYIEKENIDIF